MKYPASTQLCNVELMWVKQCLAHHHQVLSLVASSQLDAWQCRCHAAADMSAGPASPLSPTLSPSCKGHGQPNVSSFTTCHNAMHMRLSDSYPEGRGTWMVGAFHLKRHAAIWWLLGAVTGTPVELVQHLAYPTYIQAHILQETTSFSTPQQCSIIEVK